jgi:hypothetical protein
MQLLFINILILTLSNNIKRIEQSYFTKNLNDKIVLISPPNKYYIFENKKEEEIYIKLNSSDCEIYSQAELNSYLINKNILKTDSNAELLDYKWPNDEASHDQSLNDTLFNNSREVKDAQKESVIARPSKEEETLPISLQPQYINLKDLFYAYDETLSEPENIALFVLYSQANPIIMLPIRNKIKVELGKHYFHYANPFNQRYENDRTEANILDKQTSVSEKTDYIIQKLLLAFDGSNIKEVDETIEEHVFYIINNLPYNMQYIIEWKPPFTIEIKEYNEQNIILANEAQNNHMARLLKQQDTFPNIVPQLAIFNNKIFTLNEYFLFFIKCTNHNKYFLIKPENTIFIFKSNRN